MRMLGLGRTTLLGLADAAELPRLGADWAVRFAGSGVERLVERMQMSEQLLTSARTAGLKR
jgi:hypothetical protein